MHVTSNFSFSHSVFRKACFPGALKGVIVWEWVNLGFATINSLPNDKMLGLSKLKAFADYKINVNEKFNFGFERTENIVGKGENAGYQHFLIYPQCFQKPYVSGSLKVGILW